MGPRDDFRQHLETLGLKSPASLPEIKQSYRDLVMVWHPDRFAANSRLQQLAEEKTKQINLAYQQLASHWTAYAPQMGPFRQASTATAGTNRQGATPGTSSNSGSQHEQPRQSSRANTTTERVKRTKPNGYWISTTSGVLILIFTCLSFCLLGFVEYGGFSLWKALSIELLAGISLYSLVEAKSAHSQLTLWNYLKTFLITTAVVCLGIALIVAWLLKETNGRRPQA